MKSRNWKPCVVATALGVLVTPLMRGQSDLHSGVPLRVMSFNVRYGTAPDGANRWDKRKDLVLETIKRFDPDLLGTQETLELQADYLRAQLPGYTHIGVGRDDGQRKGEQMAIFYKTDRFEKLEAGHFWLCNQPEQPGSKGWDAAFPRLVTWAKLRDRRTDKAVLWLNTHWDHQGHQARIESPKVIRQWLADHGKGTPLIITGDFNSTEDSPQYRTLLGGNGVEPKLTDTYRQVHPKRQPDEASANGFTDRREGSRIDWIMCSSELVPVEATIDRFNKDGRYPSDHYPVTAVLRWVKQ